MPIIDNYKTGRQSSFAQCSARPLGIGIYTSSGNSFPLDGGKAGMGVKKLRVTSAFTPTPHPAFPPQGGKGLWSGDV